MIKQVRIEIKNAVNQIEFKVLFAAILLISLISILLNCFQDTVVIFYLSGLILIIPCISALRQDLL